MSYYWQGSLCLYVHKKVKGTVEKVIVCGCCLHQFYDIFDIYDRSLRISRHVYAVPVVLLLYMVYVGCINNCLLVNCFFCFH